MGAFKKGSFATGGSRPSYVPGRRMSDDEWDELLAEKKVPAQGRGTPKNLIRRPPQLPPMRNIKDAG